MSGSREVDRPDHGEVVNWARRTALLPNSPTGPRTEEGGPGARWDAGRTVSQDAELHGGLGCSGGPGRPGHWNPC